MASVSTVASAPGAALSRDRALRIAAWILGCAAALIVVAAVGVSVWAQHSFSIPEAIVALHSSMFAKGEGLYYPMGEYPYTAAAYGPLFYTLTAGLHLLGLPLYLGARLISIAALVLAIYLVGSILKHLRVDSFSRAAGLLLAGSTTTVLFWGTAGQVDMLAVALSLWAFERFLAGRLIAAGVLVVLAVFTKQTALASGAAIALSLLLANRKTFAIWTGGVLTAGLAAAAALQFATHGAWAENAILANVNPFEWPKLWQQANYFVLTNCGVVIIALAGWRRSPLAYYAIFATLLWLGTAPKTGSDLNYQLEMTIVWGMAAACALDRLEFFPHVLNGSKSWVTLLQIPLVLHLVVNMIVSTKALVERSFVDAERRPAIAALGPYLGKDRKLVLSAEYDALVHWRGSTDLETFYFTMLTEAGRIDPSPVVRDLVNGRFASVILTGDVNLPPNLHASPESRGIPEVVRAAIAAHYHLAATIPEPIFGPYYVYEPLM